MTQPVNGTSAERRPVVSDPEIRGGVPAFAGTRVPAQTLIDYLVAGDGLEEFLTQYPSVRREQALEALELMRDALTSPA